MDNLTNFQDCHDHLRPQFTTGTPQRAHRTGEGNLSWFY
jgi:hypothetical protein